MHKVPTSLKLCDSIYVCTKTLAIKLLQHKYRERIADKASNNAVNLKFDPLSTID